jgi:hypothetical protein
VLEINGCIIGKSSAGAQLAVPHNRMSIPRYLASFFPRYLAYDVETEGPDSHERAGFAGRNLLGR